VDPHQEGSTHTCETSQIDRLVQIERISLKTSPDTSESRILDEATVCTVKTCERLKVGKWDSKKGILVSDVSQ
jgi:hypothetical protein